MISLKTKIPGPRSSRILSGLKQKNGAWGSPYPLVFSGKGSGPYCQDIEGNRFLDFASQVATNPLGYNHPSLLKVLTRYRRSPIKYAGQDFAVEEHLSLLEELTGIAPKGLNAAFLVNSGAEAVENAIKICMRSRPGTKFGVALERAFHGRTLGALSLTGSSTVQKRGYLRIPVKRLPYTDEAASRLEQMIEQEAPAEELGFVILECVQGEGGYRFASQKMVRDLRAVTKKHNIPLICDEVQAGMGRTGKWWSFQHFGITPEAFSAAKALQVGAVAANKKLFPGEVGALSSTWGGGHVLDLAIGLKSIQIIKKHKLLSKNEKTGNYLVSGLADLPNVTEARGLGLMTAFDLPQGMRDNVVIECVKRGLLVLATGKRSIRVIPPYIITKEQVDEGLRVLEEAIKTCSRKGFTHTGKVCEFMTCASKKSW